MNPVLHDKSTKDISGLGLGTLSEAISCEVTEELGGAYELSMRYPINGRHADLIDVERIIAAPASEQSGRQAFRIYRVSKNLDGTCTINAEHVSYQLNYVPVMQFSAESLTSAVRTAVLLAQASHGFTIGTTAISSKGYTSPKPTMLRQVLAGPSGSISSNYGLEPIWDNWHVSLVQHRGADNGVAVRYGKNLQSMEYITDLSGLITAVYPYWQRDGVTVNGDPAFLPIGAGYSYYRYKLLDLSSALSTQPTEDELRQEAEAELLDNVINALVSSSLGFVPIWQTEEYKSRALIERVQLGDTISVTCSPLGIVNAKTRIVRTTYDALRERYSDIQVGTLRQGLSRTLSQIIRRLDL